MKRRTAADEAPGVRQGRLLLLPVVHYRMEFACFVRRVILERRPAVVAVELPQTLEEPFLKAVARLPRLSVVLYAAKGERVYLPVEATDPVVEALRTASEVGARTAFVEPDLGDAPSYRQRYPDTYAMTRVGPAAYVDACRDRSPELTFEDRRRAAGIAQHLRRLLEEETGEVVAVVGLPLLEGVLETLRAAQAQAIPFSVPRREGVSLLNLHPDSVPEVLTEMPFLQAVYERCRQGPPPEPPAVSHRVTRDYGPFRVVGGAVEEDKSVAAAVDRVARRVCAPGDGVVKPAQGTPPGERSHSATNSDSDPRHRSERAGSPEPGERSHSATNGESEPRHRSERAGSPEPPVWIDRQRVLLRLFAEAERRYRETTGERLQPWQRRAFGRYSRNLALAGGQLMADLFDMTVAARGVADDNLGYELWELGASYPPQTETAEIPTGFISGDSIWDGLRTIRLRRRLHRPKVRLRPRGLKGRQKEKRPGQWLEAFDGQGLCSYPPEDIVIEGYGLYLKKRGKSILSEERMRVEPFSTSMLDGVDVRETIRNWHLGGGPRLYVRALGRVSGEVGSVVVVFDEDRDDRYPYRMTWLGEHEQESDMAFYSTPPTQAIVGPGIMRAEYGGFLLSYPPRRMADVWTDADYGPALSKAETLLLAGLDYSLEKMVVYVAARPPRSLMKTMADRWGRRIVYIPIGQLSPVSLKKLRVVHILDGHDKRAVAKDFVW